MQTKPAYDFAAKRRQYRRYSIEALRYAAQDIVDTLAVWRHGDPQHGHHPNEGWYLDDLHTVKEELRKRESESLLKRTAQAACQTAGCVGLLRAAGSSCPQCEAILAALRKIRN